MLIFVVMLMFVVLWIESWKGQIIVFITHIINTEVNCSFNKKKID